MMMAMTKRQPKNRTAGKYPSAHGRGWREVPTEYCGDDGAEQRHNNQSKGWEGWMWMWVTAGQGREESRVESREEVGLDLTRTWRSGGTQALKTIEVGIGQDWHY